MPTAHATQLRRTIDKPTRDALLHDIAGFEMDTRTNSLYVSLKHHRWNEARGACVEVAETARLLEDLGWEPQDTRTQYTFTVPDDELSRAMARLVAYADEDLAEDNLPEHFVEQAVKLRTAALLVLGADPT